MRIRRAALACILLAQVLLVWGGLGLLNEFWILIPFCSGSKFIPLTWMILIVWLAGTISPLLGMIVLWKDRLISLYVISVALTIALVAAVSFLGRQNILWCDAP